MWFDFDKLKEALAEHDANKKTYTCDCGRRDGWHDWSCITMPESLRAVQRQITKDSR